VQIEAMTLSDDIIDELGHRPGLTAMEIAVNIFGRRHPFTQKVKNACRLLVKTGRLERRGKGGQSDPFTYYLPPAT
jgi:hypothetical protein